MSYSNYSQVESAIANCREFRGNSCHATFSNSDGYYRVYSYGTLIARIMPYTRAHYQLNSRKYSQTTSRLQNIVKRAWANVPVSELS